MSDWGWVALGYGVTFGSLLAYTWYLVARTIAAQRRLGDLE